MAMRYRGRVVAMRRVGDVVEVVLEQGAVVTVPVAAGAHLGPGLDLPEPAQASTPSPPPARTPAGA